MKMKFWKKNKRKLPPFPTTDEYIVECNKHFHRNQILDARKIAFCQYCKHFKDDFCAMEEVKVHSRMIACEYYLHKDEDNEDYHWKIITLNKHEGFYDYIPPLRQLQTENVQEMLKKYYYDDITARTTVLFGNEEDRAWAITILGQTDLLHKFYGWK